MALPGGNLLSGSGGYLQLWNWQAIGSSSDPAARPINYRWMDVAWWRLVRTRKTKKLAYTGCVGSTRRRLISRDWELHCRVWWDYARAPELQLEDGDTLAVKLVIGDETTWQGSYYPRGNNFAIIPPDASNSATPFANGRGILPAGSTFIPSYCSPQAIFAMQDVNCSSAGDEDGIVWQDVKLEADSLMVYISNQQEADDYSSYVGQLSEQGFIAFG